jgi:hypothetical protein
MRALAKLCWTYSALKWRLGHWLCSRPNATMGHRMYPSSIPHKECVVCNCHTGVFVLVMEPVLVHGAREYLHRSRRHGKTVETQVL